MESYCKGREWYVSAGTFKVPKELSGAYTSKGMADKAIKDFQAEIHARALRTSAYSAKLAAKARARKAKKRATKEAVSATNELYAQLETASEADLETTEVING